MSESLRPKDVRPGSTVRVEFEDTAAAPDPLVEALRPWFRKCLLHQETRNSVELSGALAKVLREGGLAK